MVNQRFPNNFTTTYDLYKAALFRYCVGKCRDREIGQDLMQETFLCFLLCLQHNEKILNTRAFLYRIAHNLFIDHVRRKKAISLDQLQEEGFEPAIDLWHQTYSRLDAERPLQKLSKMRNSYGKVLHQRFMLGLAPREIATITGETANTISVRISRGLKHLRFLLDDMAPVTDKTLFVSSSSSIL